MGTEFTVDAFGNLTTAGSITSTSTTSGFLPPVMTTTQKNAISSPATGLIVYDSTLGSLQEYNGIAWLAVGNASGVTVNTGTVNHLAWYSSTSSIDSSNFLINNSTGAMTIPGELTMGASPINMNTNNIINLVDPVNPQDAATKNYVDTHASGITGSGSTNSIPRFTSSSAIGNSGITDNGITITSTSRLFTIDYPGNALNPTTEFALRLEQGSTNLYTYLDFQNAATFASATTIAIIGNSGNVGADVMVFGNGFSGNTRAFIDKVLVTCNGNTASASNYASTTVNSPIARTYTATSSGGTITLTLQLSGNAAQYQVHIKVAALFS